MNDEEYNKKGVLYRFSLDERIEYYKSALIKILNKYNKQKEADKYFKKLLTLRKDFKRILPSNKEIVIDKTKPLYLDVFLNIQDILKEINAKETILDIELMIKEIKKETKQKLKNDKLKEISLLVKDLLILKYRNKATEEVVNYIKANYKFYTIRDDEKPEIWVYQKGIYIKNGETYILEECRKILGRAYKTTFGNEVVAKIKTDTFIEQDQFFRKDTYINLIPVDNGLLCLKKGFLLPFTEDKVFFNKLPAKYKKNAKCPNIIEFLKDVIKDAEDLPVIQELFGTLLYREYTYEKAFMFIGTGRNGKSKTLELIKRLIGIENTSNLSIQRMEEDQWALAELFGKLVNLGADISHKSLKTTSRFREVTGRDEINAPRKFKLDIKFTNYAKMIFCANELPITDITPAFFKRWDMIEFPYTFVDEEEYNQTPVNERKYLKLKDPDIIKKICTTEELSGLLNWSLEGLQRLTKNKEFSNSKNTNDIKDMWIRKSDSFSAFAIDNLEEDYDNYIKKTELKREYVLYCRKNKIRIQSDKRIKHIIETTFGGFDERILLSGTQKYVWKGIRFKNKYIKENSIILDTEEIELKD